MIHKYRRKNVVNATRHCRVLQFPAIVLNVEEGT
jgi:hypothetical protein